jgi:hypothetical protein
MGDDYESALEEHTDDDHHKKDGSDSDSSSSSSSSSSSDESKLSKSVSRMNTPMMSSNSRKSKKGTEEPIDIGA